ncbi:dihydrofolate reductase [Massilia sp. YIM B02763]|uniref:dihydrofolate reductase n=1 Tax=Massilia sp. YIM B02763 TaxID=3050130 RepID=UPI0025B63ACF|nr:dihydrofolate reductase [Massilia sp. YIM B02763]MDN4054292.1 dihydrofolate reductase [Massilia sp. YIM B02763]
MSKHLTIVVAMDARRGIGIDNKLPWHLPEDLAHFKRVTLGHPIVMGRKTFDSIGRPLPGRRNIVVTRNADWRHEGVEVAHSLRDAVALAGGESASIIGGAQIFAEALDLADRMIVTHIDKQYACDTFFPEIDPARWTAVASEPQRSEAEGVEFSFVTYDKVG